MTPAHPDHPKRGGQGGLGGVLNTKNFRTKLRREEELMGFFSKDCEGCGHPLLSPPVTNNINQWMNNGVAILADGTIVTGHYNGYGVLNATGEFLPDQVENPDVPTFGYQSGATVWHQACWNAAGKPPENRGESKDSSDQGWFFEEGDHDMAEPAVCTCAGPLNGDADRACPKHRALGSKPREDDEPADKPAFDIRDYPDAEAGLDAAVAFTRDNPVTDEEAAQMVYDVSDDVSSSLQAEMNYWDGFAVPIEWFIRVDGGAALGVMGSPGEDIAILALDVDEDGTAHTQHAEPVEFSTGGPTI